MQILITLLIPLLAAFWVYMDAKEKGRSDEKALLWAFGTFMALIIFLPLWLIVRWRDSGMDKAKRCISCRNLIKNIPNARYCPYCGMRLDFDSGLKKIDIESKKDEDEKDINK